MFPNRPSTWPPSRFVAILIMLTCLWCALIIICNVIIDPLWYFSGNLVSKKNLFFNEREAKVNLYWRNSTKYDCIIFGASSATTLDTRGAGRFRCFNFAFSAGTFEEFASYARYIESFGPAPKLIVIAVDWPNLLENPPPPQIPAYVRALAPPNSFFEPYLSSTVISHSVSELYSRTYTERFYEPPDFVCDIAANHIPYLPASVLHLDREPPRFGTSKLHYIGEIRRLFPHARLVGYAPYFSAWHTAELYFEGQLNLYAAARYKIATKLDEFYDFALPSAETILTSDTYDGFHYSATANRKIARALLSTPPEDVVRTRGLSEAEYLDLYKQRTLEFINGYNVRAIR